MLKVGYGMKLKVTNLQHYQVSKRFYIKISSKVTYIYILLGDSSIYDSQLPLIIMDEEDDSLAL